MTLIAVISLPDGPALPPRGSGATGDPGNPGELRLDWHEASSGEFVGEGDQRILGGVPTSTGFLVFGYHDQRARRTRTGTRISTRRCGKGTPDQPWNADRKPILRRRGQPARDGARRLRGRRDRAVGLLRVGNEFDAQAWIRPNGSTEWAPADVKAEGLNKEQDQSIRDAVQVGSQLIAVGSSGGALEADAALWQSERGRRWTFQDGAVPPEEGVEEMTGVVMSPEGLLVIGGFVDGPQDQDAAVWTTETPQFVDRGSRIPISVAQATSRSMRS